MKPRHGNIWLADGPCQGLLLEQDQMPPVLEVMTTSGRMARYRKTKESLLGERVYRFVKFADEQGKR